jgi:hypothetical protein
LTTDEKQGRIQRDFRWLTPLWETEAAFESASPIRF